MVNLPRLLVFPRREIKALKTDPPHEDLEVFRLLPGREALDTEYSVDAHLAMYVLPETEESCPRLSKHKPALTWLKKQGLEPLMRWVVLDVDTPEHKPWAETPASWWVGQLAAIKSSPEASVAGWYKTRAGYHLVWALEPALSPGDWERYVAALRARLRRDGVHINEECKDWTRLMRLPRVTRDGEMQDLPRALEHIGTLNLLAAPKITPIGDGYARVEDPVTTEEKSKPKLELVKPPETSMDGWALVKIGPRLKDQLLTGRPFGNTKSRRIESMGERHGRDTLILSAAGALLSSMEKPDPEVVVRLMLPSVLASRRDDPQEIGDEDTLRARVKSLCEKEVAARPPAPPPADAVPEGDADPFSGLEARVSTSTLPLLIAPRASRHYFVLDDRSGGYVGPHTSEHVAKAVLDLCPSKGARAVGDRGAPRDGGKIFHEDGAFCDRIILRAGADISRYDPRTGTLYEACAQWSPLEPEYNPEIARWLELLGGPRHAKLLDWLATVRKTDRPTCVLYVQGPKRVGKSLIWEGLSRLWRSHAAVPYETLSANFDGQLAESLLVVADEKMGEHKAGRGSPSAIFRTIVTSSQRSIKRKHLPDATLEACFRLIVTSNDDDALNLREQLTTESIDAIAERILYIVSGPEAGEYLHSIGGRDHTDPWVREDGLARHVLWLEQNRKVSSGSRLLVEGEADALVGKLSSKVGINRHISAALCRYLDKYEDRKPRSAADRVMGDLGPVYHPRIFISGGDLLVNLEALHERWPLLHGERETVTRDALAAGLRTLSRDRKEHPRVEGVRIWVYRVSGTELLATSLALGIGDTDQISSLLTVPAPF